MSVQCLKVNKDFNALESVVFFYYLSLIIFITKLLHPYWLTEVQLIPFAIM